MCPRTEPGAGACKQNERKPARRTEPYPAVADIPDCPALLLPAVQEFHTRCADPDDYPVHMRQFSGEQNPAAPQQEYGKNRIRNSDEKHLSDSDSNG